MSMNREMGCSFIIMREGFFGLQGRISWSTPKGRIDDIMFIILYRPREYEHSSQVVRSLMSQELNLSGVENGFPNTFLVLMEFRYCYIIFHIYHISYIAHIAYISYFIYIIYSINAFMSLVNQEWEQFVQLNRRTSLPLSSVLSLPDTSPPCAYNRKGCVCSCWHGIDFSQRVHSFYNHDTYWWCNASNWFKVQTFPHKDQQRLSNCSTGG